MIPSTGAPTSDTFDSTGTTSGPVIPPASPAEPFQPPIIVAQPLTAEDVAEMVANVVAPFAMRVIRVEITIERMLDVMAKSLNSPFSAEEAARLLEFLRNGTVRSDADARLDTDGI